VYQSLPSTAGASFIIVAKRFLIWSADG
jgi:hypothetical protein